MPAYFKPLRRKIGIATLLIACVFMAGWMRSVPSYEIIVLNSRFLFVSGPDGCQIVQAGFEKATASNAPDFEMEIYLDRTLRNHNRTFATFRFSTLKARIHVASDGGNRRLQLVPYWLLVIPLTLFSAWLLISKPRAKQTARVFN